MVHQLLLNASITISIYILLAIGNQLWYSSTKTVNVAYAGVLTLGPYAYYFSKIHISPAIVVCFPIGVMVTVFVASLLEVLLFRPLRKHTGPGWMPFVASLGVYVVIQNSISLLFGDSTKSINDVDNLSMTIILGVKITSVQLASIFSSITIVIFFVLGFFRTKLGMAIRGISSNSSLCEMLGINSGRVITISVAIGAALGSLGAILTSLDTDLSPTLGFRLFMQSMIIMFIAGSNGIITLFFAAVLIGCLQHTVTYMVGSGWSDGASFIVLIFFLVLKPLGFSRHRVAKVHI